MRLGKKKPEVVLRVNVKWLRLDDETFTALRRAVKDITALAAKTEASAATVAAQDEDEEVDA